MNKVNYQTCKNLEYNYMWFWGDLDDCAPELTLSFCCTKFTKAIAVPLCNDPDESFAKFISRKKEIINESKRMHHASASQNPYYKACAGCDNFRENVNRPDVETDKIHHITFGINPAPCQAKCIYCSTRLEKRKALDKTTDAPAFELFLKHIKHFRKKGLLADEIVWTLGAGEITIHPFRDKIYEAIGNDCARWLSNCFIYDPIIGINLNSNPRSELIFSIDAGTPKTWHKIKGVDNFNQVNENVLKYIQSANNHAEQIVLKYLLLPGINDDIKNFSKFINFVNQLKIKRVCISKNNQVASNEAQIMSASTLAFLLLKEGLTPTYNIFNFDDIYRIYEIADALHLRHKAQQ